MKLELIIELAEHVKSMKPTRLAFANGILIGKEPKDAYIASTKRKVTERSAIERGCRWKKAPDIKRYIELSNQIEAMSMVDERETMRQRVVKELESVAFFNIQDTVDEQGNILQINELSRSAAAAITKIRQRVIKSVTTEGEDGEPDKQIDILDIDVVQEPKLKALEQLCKIYQFEPELGTKEEKTGLSSVVEEIQQSESKGLPQIPDD